jgi:CDP-diacylglycerol--serine O-phosphatidyltransferase
VLPTLITLANGVCGFGAITLAARIPRGMIPLDETAVNWLWCSALLILLAMVFDALDGRVARMARSTSDFGAHLDSLCDTISFGVAPAFLLLKLCSDHARFSPEGVWIKALWIVAVLYVMCTVLRLARFNVETDEKPESHLEFSGLPSPAAAGAIASVAILRNELYDPPVSQLLVVLEIDPGIIEQVIELGLPLATVALAMLMVSRLPYPHIMNQMVRGRHSFAHVVKLVFAAVAVLLLRQLALPLLFWAYVLASPVHALAAAAAKYGIEHEPVS